MDLNFKLRSADMKRLATAQEGEVAADLVCRVSRLAERFHALKIDAQSTEVVVHSGWFATRVLALHTLKAVVSQAAHKKLFGARCFVWV